jgi:hypothetical protein
LFLTVPGAPNFDDRSESGIIEGKGGRLVTTIHVRYEILDDPGRPHPDSAPDSFAWGVQAVGLPGDLGAFGVGDTLAEALDDLGEGIRALFSAEPVPEELTREIAVTVGDAALCRSGSQERTSSRRWARAAGNWNGSLAATT